MSILALSDLRTTTLDVRLSDLGEFQFSYYIGIKLSTSLGVMEILAVYSPSRGEPDTEGCGELIGPSDPANIFYIY